MGVSQACRQPLSRSSPGGPRPCLLQGCYPQGPVNSLWPMAPSLSGTWHRGGAGRKPKQGSRETAAKESAGVAAEKRERRNSKMTLKEDDQQPVTVKGLYQPAQRHGTQLRSNTAPGAPVPGPDSPGACSCVSMEHPGATAPLLSHGSPCKHRNPWLPCRHSPMLSTALRLIWANHKA